MDGTDFCSYGVECELPKAKKKKLNVELVVNIGEIQTPTHEAANRRQPLI